MALRVPLGSVFRSGTITSLVLSDPRFTNALWLPLPLFGASSKPASRRALITSFDDMAGSFVIEPLLPDEL